MKCNQITILNSLIIAARLASKCINQKIKFMNLSQRNIRINCFWQLICIFMIVHFPCDPIANNPIVKFKKFTSIICIGRSSHLKTLEIIGEGTLYTVSCVNIQSFSLSVTNYFWLSHIPRYFTVQLFCWQLKFSVKINK